MACSGLLILGFVLNVAHCLEMLGQEPRIEITHNITAVLGEVVHLSCRYLGESEILSSKWIRQINSKVKSRGLSGFSNGQAYKRHDFSEPASLTNLTVQLWVSSVDVEGEYICEFESEEGVFSERAFITVVARPDVQILVNAEIINGTQYQSVSCSAVGGRPSPQISWLVNGHAASDYPFTVSVSNEAHWNGTFTQSSVLRFPTHLQDADSVTCDVQHPTLPNPKLTTVGVETYVRPNVTIVAEMVQRGGNEFWVVSCISSGGRPDTDVSLALSTDEELQRENSNDTQRRSVFLPIAEYEGRNVTCVFDHPKFTHLESRAITLPSFYLSRVQLVDSRPRINIDDVQHTESLELQEGRSGIIVGLEVVGNVPRYNVTCKKDEGPLPAGLELVGSSLTVPGPVEHHHSGLYECVFSYHHLEATVQINITVRPRVVQPVPPTVRVDLWTKGGLGVMECSAADAVPAANVSWLLPKGVSGESWFNFTSHNGSHSVTGVFLLPACSPWELTAECVINHPAFEEPEHRSITLPLCARPNITVNSSTEWKDGEQFTKVDCSADSVAPAAAITWHVGHSDNSIIGDPSEPEVQADGSVSARSSVHFLSSLYAGQNLTCVVEHPSLEESQERTIQIPVQKAPLLRASVVRQQDSPLWLAVCDCRGDAVGTNLAWVLPENAKGQTSLQSEYEGRALRARLTYQFPLALHEGQDLTCVYRFKHGITEKRTVHVPRYYISAVRVLNHTSPLRSRYGGEPAMHRLALEENHHDQKILLRVDGNVPQYDLNCQRSDGSPVHMEGLAMVFKSELTERDGGLYTCRASFHHHVAAVTILVEVTCEDKQLTFVVMSCVFSALAILFIFIVPLWVCSARNRRTKYKKRDYLSEPSSPEVKKSERMDKDSKEYAQLISYSIVLDVKSAV